MKVFAKGFLCLCLVLLFSSAGFAAVDHSFLESYEGSKTCRTCHETQADEITHALHYRLLGQVQGVYDYFKINTPVTGEWGKGNRY